MARGCILLASFGRHIRPRVRLFVLNTIGVVDSVPPWERVRRRARAHEGLENITTTSSVVLFDSRPPSSLDDSLQHAANRGGPPSHDDVAFLTATWPPLTSFFLKKEGSKHLNKATRTYLYYILKHILFCSLLSCATATTLRLPLLLAVSGHQLFDGHVRLVFQSFLFLVGV